MPISSHIDEAKGLTVFKVTGMLRYDELLTVVKSFYAEDPTKHVLWDMIDATEIQVTSKEVETIANFRLRFEGKRTWGKTAIVAQKDIIFGLSRMFQIQSDVQQAPYPVKVFRSIDAANQWIEEP